MPKITQKNLTKFTENVLKSLNINEKDAQITADVLVQADLRGVASHGVARLKRYVDGLEDGLILKNTKPEIIQEAPSTAAIDAKNGLGQPAGYFAMNLAIEKAQKTGIGVVTVKNSNHYGIAGYYPLMALEHNLIGISLTNTNPLVAPTFATDMMIGTNPISLAVPGGKELPFVLDMATSTVPRGKLEVYNRAEKPLPSGWALDETGQSSSNAGHILKNMLSRTGGGLAPLGGIGELFGGHKGYGLAMLVDILSGVLSGSAYGDGVGARKHPNVGHFFMALNIENFISLDEFKQRMDDYIRKLKNLRKAQDQAKIYIHGEKEFQKEADYKKNGIPLQEKVVDVLKEYGERFGIDLDLY